MNTQIPTPPSNGKGKRAHYKRVLLKLSGEALSGQGGTGIDLDQTAFIAHRVKAVHALGVQIGVVIGAGNLWRRRDAPARWMCQIPPGHNGLSCTALKAAAV